MFGRVKNAVFGVGPPESRAVRIFGAVAEGRRKQEIQTRTFPGYRRLGFLEKIFKDGLLGKRVGDLHGRDLVLCLDHPPAFAT